MDERVRQAERLHERAVFSGQGELLAQAGQELDAAEAELALTRGKLMHTRYLISLDEGAAAEPDPGELALFERAAGLSRALGDTRGEAGALFWAGCYHQVILRDQATAAPLLAQSLELATRAGDKPVMAEALRHLGIAAHASGDLEEARQRLEESTRLRRAAGHQAGAAANMVGLAYIAAAQGRADDAAALLSEGRAIAEAAGADRVVRQLDEARAATAPNVG